MAGGGFIISFEFLGNFEGGRVDDEARGRSEKLEGDLGAR
jgi:hypothetical protein